MATATSSSAAADGKYSDTPLASIDIASLAPSRFLHDNLPYRDSSGRVNLNLLRHSKSLLTEATPPTVVESLERWLRHAERWHAQRSHGCVRPRRLDNLAPSKH